jgi:hypothetical protein
MQKFHLPWMRINKSQCCSLKTILPQSTQRGRGRNQLFFPGSAGVLARYVNNYLYASIIASLAGEDARAPRSARFLIQNIKLLKNNKRNVCNTEITELNRPLSFFPLYTLWPN